MGEQLCALTTPPTASSKFFVVVNIFARLFFMVRTVTSAKPLAWCLRGEAKSRMKLFVWAYDLKVLELKRGSLSSFITGWWAIKEEKTVTSDLVVTLVGQI